ncbi:hypothetical protein [Sphingopyxis sp. 550A]
MTGSITTGVSTHICCAHTGSDGRLHGHTWIITAWFPAGQCALDLKSRLAEACAPFDHAEPLYDLSTGEGIVAALVEALPAAVLIEAARPPEGIYARWTAPARQTTDREDGK